jgi:preprotein translocase subunit SecG
MLDIVFWVLMIGVYLPCCIALIGIVLLQKGKGVGFAGAFGMGGGGDSVFGPTTARSLPQKLTYVAAFLFMSLALLLSAMSGVVGSAAAPDLVDETGGEIGSTSSGSLEALFGTQPEEAPVVEETEAAPVAVEAVETPAETPAVEETAAEEAVETPAPEAPAAEEAVEAPADAPVEAGQQ